MELGTYRSWVNGRTLLLLVLGAAFASHAYNMFRYPIYLGDEGIYMEQAWAILREFRLAPYTYFYDHAPVGWIMIAGWVLALPRQFLTFGMAINSGRLFMLVLHLLSVFLLFRVTQKFSGSNRAAFLVSLIFSLSPLALYYQRMVLLDNIMVFWFLLSLYLVMYGGQRLMALLASGAALGLAVLSKENGIFFVPVLGYLLYSEVKDSHHRRFAMAGWAFTGSAVVSIYVLYAFLKDELFPAGGVPLVSSSPGEHVSLIGTVLWQLSRRGGGIMDPGSDFWVFFNTRWWPRDGFIIAAGTFAMFASLALGLSDRQRNREYLMASLLALPFAFYLTRGSVLLEFYMVPVIPFYALCIGLLAEKVFRSLPGNAGNLLFVVGVAVLASFYVYQARDHYTLNITQVQYRQLQYIREVIPKDAVISVDDDLWVDLHEAEQGIPVYANAQSHWKVEGDPAIRDKILHNDWRSLDYLIMSNKLYENLHPGADDFILAAYSHTQLMARFVKGDVAVEVRKIVK